MTGGSQLRRKLESEVKTALAERGFRRQRSKERFHRTGLVEEPMIAGLLVGLDTDRYGLVRLAGSVQVVCPAVDEAYESAPDEALSKGQRIYRGRLQNALASLTFARLRDPSAVGPHDWLANDEEQAQRALEDFLAFIDGPVMAWFEQHATLEAVSSAADEAAQQGSDANSVRNVAVLEALVGRLDEARERLEWYAAHPREKVDSPEQVEAFRQWLRTLQPRPELRIGR
jgi:hypothetical protein